MRADALSAMAPDVARTTGKEGATYAANPLPRTAATFGRGRERYDIYCAPCHDRAGTGNGMIVERGFKQPPTFHDDRMRSMQPGYFFQVMTQGFATMPSYAMQVKPEDRWAIAAYIKALQLSRHATAADPTADERERVEKGETMPAAASGSGHAPAHGKEAHGG